MSKSSILSVLAVQLLISGMACAQPAAGDTYTYPVINHDQPVEHEFATPYPAYVFPLDTGKKWSVRVEGRDAATGQRRSVRVDGAVLGTERVTTPAGAFDTIKVRRR